jgi:hypothetical protein
LEDFILESKFILHHVDGWSYEVADWPEEPDNTCQVTYLEEGVTKDRPLVISKQAVPLLIKALQNWLDNKNEENN